MKFSTSVALFFAASLSVQAFQPTSSTRRLPTRLFAEEDDKIAALRAAAAKARADAERLRQELGKPAEESTAVATKMSSDEVKSLVSSLLTESSTEKRRQGWQSLQEASKVFGSANLRTFPVSMAMLEQRTSLNAASLGLTGGDDVDLDDFKYATLYVAGGSAAVGVAALALLPPNVGATVCYLVALVPIVFLGIGSTAPGIIAGAIKSVKGEVSGQGGVDQRTRMCRHEAAHLCCGYWCGLPVADYQVDDSAAQVEFGVTGTGKNGEYTATEVAALAVTGLAGSVGEALQWGQAAGAADDLLQIQTVFRRAQDFYGAAAQQDVTRWAAFTAAQLLRQNADKYEQVVAAMERSAPLEDCVTILEN